MDNENLSIEKPMLQGDTLDYERYEGIPSNLIEIAYESVVKAVYDGILKIQGLDPFLEYVELSLGKQISEYKISLSNKQQYLNDCLSSGTVFSDEISEIEEEMVDLDNKINSLDDLEGIFINGSFRNRKSDFALGLSFVLINWISLAGSFSSLGFSALQRITGHDPSSYPLVALYLGYEAIPGLGGLQALLSTTYAGIKYGIPETMKRIFNREERKEIPLIITKTLANMTELGFLTMPFLIDKQLKTRETVLLYEAIKHNPNSKKWRRYNYS